MKLVSVLLPTYNVENYIEEALESILNQTYKNIEVIVIDDFSSDKTYSILKNMAKKDSRVRLFKNEKNLKISRTLNLAFQKSKGHYICRMDGDDVSHPKRIEKKVKFLEKNPGISLVGCSVNSINEYGKIINKKKMFNDYNLIQQTIKYATPIYHIWVARREVYDKLDGYRNIPYVEDYDFLLRMQLKGLKFTNIDNFYGYSIRLRNGNTISSAGIYQRKAHRYCYKIFKMSKSKDCKVKFNINDFNEFISSSKHEKKMFKISNDLLTKSLLISNKYDIRRYIWPLISYLLSSEQRKYINGKILVKIYEKV